MLWQKYEYSFIVINLSVFHEVVGKLVRLVRFLRYRRAGRHIGITVRRVNERLLVALRHCRSGEQRPWGHQAMLGAVNR